MSNRVQSALRLRRMIVAALCVAMAVVLPKLLLGVQVLNQSISPMHIPALICGLTCGWQWGLGAGFLMPILAAATGMPPWPVAWPMAFECAAYGFFTGLCYPMLLKKMKASTKRLVPLLISMVIAMVLGRLVGGAAKALLLTFGLISSQSPFTFAAFLTSYFVGTAVGAVIHLVAVPAVVTVLEEARLSPMSLRPDLKECFR